MDGRSCPLATASASGGTARETSGEDGKLMVASADEDGAIPADELDSTVWAANELTSSIAETACFKSSGTGILSASATAAVMAAAPGYRSTGVLARPLRRTFDSAGGRFGFTRCGSGGVAVRCCIITPVTLSPWNGGTPAHTS